MPAAVTTAKVIVRSGSSTRVMPCREGKRSASAEREERDREPQFYRVLVRTAERITRRGQNSRSRHQRTSRVERLVDRQTEAAEHGQSRESRALTSPRRP